MKRLVYILVLFYTITLATAQGVPETKLPTPPNCTWLRGNLFIDKTEISNIHWLEYLHYLHKDSSENHYINALPDTSVWLNLNDSVKWMNYLRYPSYRTHPVVGISFEQAQAYCSWRGEAVKLSLQNHQQRHRRNIPEDFNFHFRLPTPEEWEFAASGGLLLSKYPYGFENIYQRPTLNKNWKSYYHAIKQSSISEKDFKTKFMDFKKSGKEPFFNCLKEIDSVLTYGALTPLSTKTKKEDPKFGNPYSKPNNLNVYDMIGNVAEMTAQKGIAKGGSWAHRLNESSISSELYYEEPTSWLGFRCICEVVKVED